MTMIAICKKMAQKLYSVDSRFISYMFFPDLPKKMAQKLFCVSSARAIATVSYRSYHSFGLLGPPEIYHSVNISNKTTSSENPVNTTVETGDPFMESLIADFNMTAKSNPQRPNMCLTENNSPTYSSSGNPCLDFFFHVVPDTHATRVAELLQLAWEQDNLTALKLVCNLRGVRGTGKMDKDGFYASALWMHANHPKTLASNLSSIAKFGYFKDLLEILELLLYGPDAKAETKIKTRNHQLYLKEIARRRSELTDSEKKKLYCKLISKSKEVRMLSKEERISTKKEKMSSEEKRISQAKQAIERYNKDPAFQVLHDEISLVFAEQLKSDLKCYNSGETRKISLAAKWCPSIDSSYDRSILICESIARRIFTKDEYPEYEGIEDAHYAYRIRDRLRKQVLVPLREVKKIPELYMSSNKWGSLIYSHVPSVAMKTYKTCFFKHDGDRFKKYLVRVKTGKSNIAAGALLPHQIIQPLVEAKYSPSLEDEAEVAAEVAELQWRRMIEDLSSTGSLKNCLAICDVSGSMEGTPMMVSIALGLVVSELSEFPWKGRLITFSENPQLQCIHGDDLRSKTRWIREMEWNMNTDFQKVFDVILDVAKKNNISEEGMIKRLFVFSDMEFDQASSNEWETDYEAITRKFKESGFASVPEIVFWNLRDSMATPVPSDQKGVALISGFSKNLIKMFLKQDDELLDPITGSGVKKAISYKLDPITVMERAISGDEYSKLVVVD